MVYTDRKERNMNTSCEQCLNELQDGAPIFHCRECEEDYCSEGCLHKHFEQNAHRKDARWVCITNPNWVVNLKEAKK